MSQRFWAQVPKRAGHETLKHKHVMGMSSNVSSPTGAFVRGATLPWQMKPCGGNFLCQVTLLDQSLCLAQRFCTDPVGSSGILVNLGDKDDKKSKKASPL